MRFTANRNEIHRWAALVALVVVVSGSLTAQQAIPIRLVSTSPSITETLFALGLGDRVVGVSSYCRFPPEVATLPQVGAFLSPDAEVIARLKPDLVFVHTGPNTAAAQLTALRIPTAAIDRGSLPTIFSTIRQIGSAAGVPDRADALIATINTRLDHVKTTVAARAPRTVLIIVGRQTGTLSDIVAVGHSSYLNEVAAIAGGRNALPVSVKQEYPRISIETVISLSPDVIIDIGEMGESPSDSDRRRQITESLWKRQTLVKAAREGRVFVTTDEAFTVPGPRIVNVAETMAGWFHGVRFP
jgi:ABC-type Fe3+-hydroxamate transport system substrate-binding protein